MTIPEAYAMLNLDYKSSINDFRQNYFNLRKEAHLSGNLDLQTKIDMAARIVKNCMEYKEENKPEIVSQDEEYEFYEHMYDNPKSEIPFEELLKREVTLNNAKTQIRQMLLTMAKDMDYIYDLDTLREYIETNGLMQLIENGQKNNKAL